MSKTANFSLVCERRNVLDAPPTLLILSPAYDLTSPLLPSFWKMKEGWAEIVEGCGGGLWGRISWAFLHLHTVPHLPPYTLWFIPQAVQGRRGVTACSAPLYAALVFEIGCRSARWWPHVVRNLETTRVILCKLRQTHRIYGIFFCSLLW